MVNWSQACTTQANRPPSQLQQANLAGNLFAVSAAQQCPHPLPPPSASLALFWQVVSFAAAAAYSGMWLCQLKRMDAANIWPMLGWFSGLVFVGSVAGVAAWYARMQSVTVYHEALEPGATAQQRHTLFASIYQFTAAFFFLYGLEFLCLIIPKLMLLGRLTSDATHSSLAQEPSTAGVRRSWFNGRALVKLFRVMAAVVVMCSAGGTVAFAVAGAYFLQISALYIQAAGACDSQGRDTPASLALEADAATVNAGGKSAIEVQNVSEAVTLLLVSVAYVLLVTLCVAVFRRAERLAAQSLLAVSSGSSAARDQFYEFRTTLAVAVVEDTMQAAVDQRRRLIIACAIVLVAFPLRAAYDCLQAFSVFNLQYNPACLACGPCQSDQFLIFTWISLTPELQPIIVAFSSPLPLVWSLWLITTAHASAVKIALGVLRARLGRSAPRR
jgi:hypothetical protein